MFNEICINEEMLPKYTYCKYIYVYFWLIESAFFNFLNQNLINLPTKNRVQDVVEIPPTFQIITCVEQLNLGK